MFHPYSFYLQKHKNAKIKTRVCPPIFQLPLITSPRYPYPQCPNRLLLCPISPFGISQFAIWGIPFYHLGCPILPFGMSHFTIWGIPFPHLGCPIWPFGVSHFTFWGIPFYHLGYIFGTFAHNVQPRFSVCLLRFSLQKCALSLSVGKIDLAPFCIFVFLCFCILQMRNCFRSAIETSFIALTYSHFWCILIRHDKSVELASQK